MKELPLVESHILVPLDHEASANHGSAIPDVYKWAFEQADHIRAGRFDKIDRINAADEIEDVGNREYDALASSFEVLLAHMLKWDFQPERRSRSWEQTIAEHRGRVEYRLKDSGSLKSKRDEMINRAYKFAERKASRETKLSAVSLPQSCAYSWSDIMERPFDYVPD